MFDESKSLTASDIIHEIEEFRSAAKRDLISLGETDLSFINPFSNFSMRLPGGLLETRYIPQLGSDYQLTGDPEYNSSIYLHQTLGQFVDTVRQTVIEIGGEALVARMIELQRLKLDHTKHEDTRPYIHELLQLGEPVYIQLRLKGYTTSDLRM